MKNANFIAIDFETATLSSRMPCQIGITIVREGSIVSTLEFLIKPPQNRYSQKCTSIHGITPEMTKESPEFPQVWHEVRHLFDAAFVVAHNISFDIDVLYHALDFYGLERPIFMGEKCTYKEVTGHNLSESCLKIGIPLSKAHSAGCDSEACARIFLKYLSGEVKMEISPNNESDEIKNEEWRHTKIKGDTLKKDLSCANPENPFYDKKVVISGLFRSWPDRNDLANLLKRNGADIDTNVSGKTDFLIAGIEAGWKKMKTAQENGVKIIGEDELVTIITEADMWECQNS